MYLSFRSFDVVHIYSWSCEYLNDIIMKKKSVHLENYMISGEAKIGHIWTRQSFQQTMARQHNASFRWLPSISRICLLIHKFTGLWMHVNACCQTDSYMCACVDEKQSSQYRHWIKGKHEVKSAICACVWVHA